MGRSWNYGVVKIRVVIRVKGVYLGFMYMFFYLFMLIGMYG